MGAMVCMLGMLGMLGMCGPCVVQARVMRGQAVMCACNRQRLHT